MADSDAEEEVVESTELMTEKNSMNPKITSIVLVLVLLFSVIGGVIGSAFIAEEGSTGADGDDGTSGIAGDTGEKGENGNSPLVIIENEVAGENCAAGGQVIRTGLDSNANSILELDETSDTEYLCGVGYQQGFLINTLDGGSNFQLGSYDVFGNLIQVETDDGNENRIIEYIYDTQNRAISSTEDVNHDGVTDSETTYYYDANSVMTHSLTTIVTDGAEPDYLNGSSISIKFNPDGTHSEFFYDSNANGLIDTMDYFMAPDSELDGPFFSGELYIHTSSLLMEMTKSTLDNGSEERFQNTTYFDSEGNVSASRYTQSILTYDSNGEIHSRERFIWEDGEEDGHYLAINGNESFEEYSSGDNHSDQLVMTYLVNYSNQINSIFSPHGMMFSEIYDIEDDGDKIRSSSMFYDEGVPDYGQQYTVDSVNEDMLPLWYNTTTVGNAPSYYADETIQFIYLEGGVLETIHDECARSSNPRISYQTYQLMNGVYKVISDGTDEGCDGIINSYTNKTYDSDSNQISYLSTDDGVVQYFSFEQYNLDGDLVSRNDSVSSSSGGGYEINTLIYDSQGRISTINVYQNSSASQSESLILTESITLFGDNLWGHGDEILFELEAVPYFPPHRFFIDASLIDFIDWKIPQSEL